MHHRPEDLELARRRLAEAEVRIARQRELLEELRAHGHPTDLAAAFLRSLVETERQMQARYDG